MKYRLVLAEDEPAAAENIYDIIRLYCPQYELTATAGNGAEGLAFAYHYHPNLLMTDIKMPIMNGLELIKCLHEEMPEIKTIIISGYEDFEYARTALQYGAVDYLLKPISPSTLQATLNRMIPVIENERVQKRLSLIQKLLSEEKVSDDELNAFFPSREYFAGLCRKNGLPGRFSGVKRIFPPAYLSSEETIDLYGKDDMECIHIQPENVVFDAMSWGKIPWLNQDIPGYRTIVYCNKPFPIRDLPHCIEELYNTLVHSLVIGKSRIVLSGDDVNPLGTIPILNFDRNLAFYLKENKSGKIKDILHELLELCEKTESPQFLVEEELRSFLDQVRRGWAEGNSAPPDDSVEYLVDDAFYYATDYGDLEKNLLYILEKLLPGREQGINKIDTPEFFGLIEEFVKNKLAEPLSLQQSCIHFGISQTYMSRLFRKYTGLSFNNYLTRSRIEKAKQYLSSGNTLIKEAATMTGFSDQFYFSKVFKSLTGQSPSEFISGNRQIQGIQNE